MRKKIDWPRLTDATEEEQQEFEKNVEEMMTEMGMLFAFLLHKTPDAKNFLKFRYGHPTAPGSFDLVLRKVGADDEIICPFCCNIKKEGLDL